MKISPTIILLLSCDCLCYNHLPCELFQAIWLARTQSNCLLQAITASKEKKARNVKAQGTGGPQFDCPTAVSQNIDVDNVKYTITLNKI